MEEALFQSHNKYKEARITNRRFKHSDLVPLIENLGQAEGFEVKIAGKSIEGRPIYLVRIGTGKIRVLLWSQMHGDEATATMAIFDLFNFFKDSDLSNPYKKQILSDLTLYFIPMLNPDGAEVFKRRNALDIDLNRDAQSLQAPESQILKRIRDEVLPDFGFNLHDQNIRYAAGTSGKPATISLLAPPYDFENSVNDTRRRAILLVAQLNKNLHNFIPGGVGKWSDEFEPRAFGDNIQKWGTSTILIESGGFPNDLEKQFIRQLNYFVLLSAFKSIATKQYEKESIRDYDRIPENSLRFFDLLIKNVVLKKDGQSLKVDIGINRYEADNEGFRSFYYKSVVEDIGDLSVFRGYEELDGSGMNVEPGKIYNGDLAKPLTHKKCMELLNEGFTSVAMENVSPWGNSTNLPINILSPKTGASTIELTQPANFVLKAGDKIKSVIVNGFLYDAESGKSNIKNGLVD